MSYESPIKLICNDIQWHIERETVKAVQRFFPLVDEEELAKALKYDRDQYAAGFIDGKAARDAEVKRGMWIYNDEAYAGGSPYGHYECDQCGEYVPHKTNFCPNCGADMRTPTQVQLDEADDVMMKGAKNEL